MRSKVILPPNNVRSAYEDFLEAFQSTCDNANVEVRVPVLPLRDCFTESRKPATAEFRRCLYLRGWRCRKLGGGRRLDIVIRAVETFETTQWLLTKSTVFVNYIVVKDSAAKLAQSLHFDFMATGQKDHPFFHAHLNDGRIPEELPEQQSDCWVTTRIPTPDMTLASVLYCVVADHLGAGHFKQFAEKVESIQGRMPHPGFDALRRSLQTSSKHFKSSHWFAHMR
jgi:hypothetical protein